MPMALLTRLVPRSGLVIGLLCIPVLASSPGRAAGQWLHFRGDGRLTGRSALKGRITQPAVKWKYHVGGRETRVEAWLDGSASGVCDLPAEDRAAPPGWEAAWGLGGRWLDLDGTGTLQPVGPLVGDWLPGRPGLERFEVESNTNRPGPAVARMYGRRDGRWVELWKRPRDPGEDWTEGLVGAATPIFGDFDAGGRPQVAFLGFHWLYVLDAETGRLKAKAQFLRPGEAESGRGYGWFGACDLDGDGKAEFIVIGDTQNQVAVLGWDAGGGLVRRWHRVLNFDAYRRISVVRPGTDPLHDIDGDGRKEIVFSVYNYDPATGRADGDDAWHVWALDGVTGATKLDIRGQCLAGLHDLDGDGVSELFTTAAPAALVPEPSALTVYGFKGGNLVKRWQAEGESFQTRRVAAFPPTANSSASGEPRELVCGPVAAGGRPVFWTRRLADAGAGAVRLTAWQPDAGGAIRAVGSLTGPRAEVLATRPARAGEAGVLVAVRAAEGGARLATEGFTGRTVASRLTGAPMSPAAVARLAPGDRPAVVVEGDGEMLHAFSPYAGRGRERRWRRPGRGMWTGGGHAVGEADRGGIVLADLGGDGRLATVAATTGPAGCSRLVAYGPGGEERWHHDFPGVPGALPAHNAPGLTMWFAGRFTDPRHFDVFATPRPKSQEEGVLLSGTDGHAVWRRERIGDVRKIGSRPVGGSWLAAFDYDGDGRDDLVGMYPDLLYVLDGPTGRVLLERDSAAIFPRAPIKPFNAMPVVADFRGEGRPQIFWGACDRALGLLDMHGRVLWQEERRWPRGPGILPGVGDIDGDGQLEVLVVGQADRGRSVLTCYAGSTGRVKWELPLPGDTFRDIFGTDGTPLPPAVADVDGDGRDDCLFVIGRTLYAVSAMPDGRAGRFLWQVELPGAGRLGPPAVADVAGDGKLQIVVVGRDGYVYGIGDRTEPGPR